MRVSLKEGMILKKDFIEIELKVLSYNDKIMLFTSGETKTVNGTYGDAWDTWED